MSKNMRIAIGCAAAVCGGGGFLMGGLPGFGVVVVGAILALVAVGWPSAPGNARGDQRY